MKLHDLAPAKGSRRSAKRVGRGPGSGTGKTAGRGSNGQRSRSGYSSRVGFEGGQMPLVRRVPKRGFTNIFRVEYTVVNLHQLAQLFESEEKGTVTPTTLQEHGLIRAKQRLKVLGDGDIKIPLHVSAHKFSRTAREKIEAAGGSCEELER